MWLKGWTGLRWRSFGDSTRRVEVEGSGWRHALLRRMAPIAGLDSLKNLTYEEAKGYDQLFSPGWHLVESVAVAHSRPGRLRRLMVVSAVAGASPPLLLLLSRCGMLWASSEVVDCGPAEWKEIGWEKLDARQLVRLLQARLPLAFPRLMTALGSSSAC
jgi:hypothetical protein